MTVQPKIWRTEDVVRFSGTDIDRTSMNMLENGGYVVTWRESLTTVKFQIYDGNGLKVGDAQSLNYGNAGSLYANVQAYGSDGGFVATWVAPNGASSTSEYVYFWQKLNADGTPFSGVTFIASGATVPAPTSPTLAMGQSSQGGWTTAYLHDNKVKLALFASDSSGAMNTVTVHDGAASEPDVTWLGGTQHLVSYKVDATTLALKIVDGTNVSDAAASITGVEAADIVGLKDGSGNPTGAFVVVADRGVTGGIHAYLYAAPSAAPTMIEISAATKPSSGDFSSVTALRGGGFAVAYIAQPSTPDADGRTDFGDVFVRVFDANGNAVGSPLRVNSSAATDSIGAQKFPTISEMHDGRLAITWLDPTVGNGRVSSTIVDARQASVTVEGTTTGDTYAPSEHSGDNFDGGDGFDTLTFEGASAGVAVDLAQERGTAGIATGDIYTSFEKVVGSRFDDTLTGGTGAEVLQGGAGNDTYIIASAGEVLVEAVGGGTDLVYTHLTYSLATTANVENLYATGTDAITLFGNGLNNRLVGNAAMNAIYGNAGNDVLDGGAGADRLEGGTGNDVYYVDNTGDRVVEISTGGTADIVYSRVSYTLASYVERLYASGSNSISLTGNTLSNVIKGNAGSNKINGGYGKDTLYGGLGKDIFMLTTKPSSSNYDKIADYNVRDDSIQLDNKYFTKLGSGSVSSPKKLASSAFWKGSKAHDSSDRIIYDSAKGYLYYDADGTGSSKQVLIATMSTKLQLSSADFYVI